MKIDYPLLNVLEMSLGSARLIAPPGGAQPKTPPPAIRKPAVPPPMNPQQKSEFVTLARLGGDMSSRGIDFISTVGFGNIDSLVSVGGVFENEKHTLKMKRRMRLHKIQLASLQVDYDAKRLALAEKELLELIVDDETSQ